MYPEWLQTINILNGYTQMTMKVFIWYNLFTNITTEFFHLVFRYIHINRDFFPILSKVLQNRAISISRIHLLHDFTLHKEVWSGCRHPLFTGVNYWSFLSQWLCTLHKYYSAPSDYFIGFIMTGSVQVTCVRRRN